MAPRTHVTTSDKRPRIVVVGAGFAGFHAARRLHQLARGRAEIVVVNPSDYFLFLPLLPEVAGGILDPRRVSVSLSKALRGIRLMLGAVDSIELDQRAVNVFGGDGARRRLTYDRLILAPGSVNKLLPIPGVSEYAHGFRSIAEALYLRDHLIRQIELADNADDPAECAALCTFVVVGAGYTGVEVAAHGMELTRQVIRERTGLRDLPLRWILIDTADRVLNGLDEQLAETVDRTLGQAGIDIRVETSIAEATADGVKLSDGRFVATRSLVWCVGVRPDPVIEGLDLPMQNGRLVVDRYLSVPGSPELFACGDSAAVPDPEQTGEATPMTAQHAQRQGIRAAENVAASFGEGTPRPYEYRSRGFLVDLAAYGAAANPLGISMGGVPAKVLTRAYHLYSLPSNRIRVACDWLLDVALGRQVVRLGLVPSEAVSLESAEAPRRDQRVAR